MVYSWVRRLELPKPLPKPAQERLCRESAQPSMPIWLFGRRVAEGNGETQRKTAPRESLRLRVKLPQLGARQQANVHADASHWRIYVRSAPDRCKPVQ